MRVDDEDLRVPDEPPPAAALYAVRYSYHWVHAWKYVVVQPATKGVGLMVASFGNKRGLEIHPGVKRLVAATGYTKPTVIEALAVLRWLGFLWRLSSAQGSNSGYADAYQLCLPRSMEHIPRVDPKTAKLPAYAELSPEAQRTALVLGVDGRLKKRSGQLTQPGGQVSQPPLVNSANLKWWAELTPPIHLTNTSTNSFDHHSASAEAGPRASSPARSYDFDNDDDCYDYVLDAFGDDLDPYEASTMEGMLSKGEHPKRIVNAIRSWRREAAA